MAWLRCALAGLVLAVWFSPGVARAACAPADPTHAQWSAIVARWVRNGRVDYAGLQRDGQPALAVYLAALSATCADDYAGWDRDAKIAFWLNAYNAFTLRLILDHYPLASIRSIGLLPLAAFRERFIPMDGLKGGMISLNDIENDTLRDAFREPRIHFALVCASVKLSAAPRRGVSRRRPRSAARRSGPRLPARSDEEPRRPGDADALPLVDLQVVRPRLHGGGGIGARVRRPLSRRRQRRRRLPGRVPRLRLVAERPTVGPGPRPVTGLVRQFARALVPAVEGAAPSAPVACGPVDPQPDVLTSGALHGHESNWCKAR